MYPLRLLAPVLICLMLTIVTAKAVCGISIANLAEYSNNTSFTVWVPDYATNPQAQAIKNGLQSAGIALLILPATIAGLAILLLWTLWRYRNRLIFDNRDVRYCASYGFFFIGLGLAFGFLCQILYGLGNSCCTKRIRLLS